MDDLSSHSAIWVEPVSVNYRGYDVWEIPPNGQGISALQILQILEGFDIKSMGYGSAAHVHHFVEAKKLAYEDLAKYYGDPKFSDIPVATLLSDSYAEKRRALINEKRVGEYHPGLSSGDHTIYMTAADKEGNMISFIQSNSFLFGSMEVPQGLGFVLQNRGGSGFVIDEGQASVYEPGKKTISYHYPGLYYQRGSTMGKFWSDGWRHATSGSCTNRYKPHRFWNEFTRSRRCSQDSP